MVGAVLRHIERYREIQIERDGGFIKGEALVSPPTAGGGRRRQSNGIEKKL